MAWDDSDDDDGADALGVKMVPLLLSDSWERRIAPAESKESDAGGVPTAMDLDGDADLDAEMNSLIGRSWSERITRAATATRWGATTSTTQPAAQASASSMFTVALPGMPGRS